MTSAAQGRAVVVGLGGRGCSVAARIAEAGAGSLALVDDAAVDEGDPRRTPVYLPPDVGSPKAEVAASRLRLMSPAMLVEAYPARVDWGNAGAIVSGADVVVDCTGESDAQLALGDACWAEGAALVVGGTAGRNGFTLVARPGEAGCWRCALPHVPLPDGPPLAGVDAVVGGYQAAAAIALLDGRDGPQAGQLALIDGETLVQTTAAVERQPACTVCGAVPASPQSTD